MVTVRYLAALLLAAAAVILCAPAAYGQVLLNDKADLYSDEQETSIISMMEDASEKTGWNFGIVTLNVDYSSGEAARSRAEKIYDETFGRDSSGVLFLCDVGYRHFVIEGDAEKYVSGRRFDKMVSRIKTLYFDYDDMGCARMFVNSVVDCYNMGELKASEKISGTAVITAVFIGRYALRLPPQHDGYEAELHNSILWQTSSPRKVWQLARPSLRAPSITARPSFIR